MRKYDTTCSKNNNAVMVDIEETRRDEEIGFWLGDFYEQEEEYSKAIKYYKIAYERR